MKENPEFLKKKYNLHNTEEVESAAKRTEKRTGEKVGQKPKEQIQNYLDRFNEILEREDEKKRERGIEALKKVLHDKFVIKENDVPEGYFKHQQQLAREQGHGDIEITEEQKAQLAEVIIADQESTLDSWIDYLSSPDATYPDWLKYFAVRGVLGMSKYDKEKKQFGKRDKGTTAPFPDLNREALAYVLDAIQQKHEGKTDLSHLTQEEQKEFHKLLQGENFAKLYAHAIEKVTPATQESLESVEGEWVKYDKGSDHMPLVESLQGYGTGWCTAGESTAKAQLKAGDFYVFYSNNLEGDPVIPRVAIRMEGDSIAEVRGVAENQNLDPSIQDVVQEKLQEFPDGEKYKKKSEDMKKLTDIEKRHKAGEDLTKEDLIFLYEIDYPIEGFGNDYDPRVDEILEERNALNDYKIIYNGEKYESDSQFVHAMFFVRDMRTGAMLLSELDDRGRQDVARRLIEGRMAISVLDHLSAFKGVDHTEVAIALIDQKLGPTLINRFQKLKGVDHQDIAERLIRAGYSFDFLKNSSKFRNIDEEKVADLVIEQQRGYDLAEHLRNFGSRSLSIDVAKHLIEAGYGIKVAENITKFKTTDNWLSLIYLLIEHGHGNYILQHLKNGNDRDFIEKVKAKVAEHEHNKRIKKLE